MTSYIDGQCRLIVLLVVLLLLLLPPPSHHHSPSSQQPAAGATRQCTSGVLAGLAWASVLLPFSGRASHDSGRREGVSGRATITTQVGILESARRAGVDPLIMIVASLAPPFHIPLQTSAPPPRAPHPTSATPPPPSRTDARQTSKPVPSSPPRSTSSLRTLAESGACSAPSRPQTTPTAYPRSSRLLR